MNEENKINNIDINTINSNEFIINFNKLSSEIILIKELIKKSYRPKKELLHGITNMYILITNLKNDHLYKIFENKNNLELPNIATSNKSIQTNDFINEENINKIEYSNINKISETDKSEKEHTELSNNIIIPLDI